MEMSVDEYEDLVRWREGMEEPTDEVAEDDVEGASLRGEDDIEQLVDEFLKRHPAT